MKLCAEIKSCEDIREWLFEQQDEKYKEFSSKLIPNIDKNKFIGVRIPIIRKLAKIIANTDAAQDFLNALPHHYIEENHLHAFLINCENDFDKALLLTEDFVTYIDNWSVCDSFRPQVFKKNRKALYKYVEKYIASSHTYTKRFGIGLLLSFYLDGAFDKKHLKLVADIKSDEYYINMMIAWYFATALFKQPQFALPYLENRTLDTFTHNKTIQKAIESFRVSESLKEYLKTLKINTRGCNI